MSLTENIIEIKPLKIKINEIFEKKISLGPLLEFSLLQKIIEEFINRQNETDNKIKELEKKITSLNLDVNNKYITNITIKENDNNNNTSIINSQVKKDISLIKDNNNKHEDVENKENQDNKDNKQNVENQELNKDKEEKKVMEELNERENNNDLNLEESNKNEYKKIKILFQQITGKVKIIENKYNELLENFNLSKKESKKEFQSIKNKNKENNNKISELENIINELQNKKEEEINNLDVINDVGGDIDTDKVKTWIKNLEQKLTKKIEFCDRRNKQNETSFNELKNELNDIKNKFINFESNITDNFNFTEKNNEVYKDEDENEKKDETEKENKLESSNKLKTVFENFVTKDDLNLYRKEQEQLIKEITDKISENPFFNKDIEKITDLIIPKFGDMSQKLKDNVSKSIENNEKYIKNQIKKLDIDSIKDEILSLKKELKNKLDKENLGSINLKIEDMENIEENLRTMIEDNKNNLRFCNDKYSKLIKALETLKGQVLTLLEEEVTKNDNDIKESKKDLSSFLSKNEFEEEKEKLNKKIEKIFLQETDNYRMVQELIKKLRVCVTETDLQNLEQYFLNIMSENKAKISKTFIEKIEAQKSMKYLELRIKQLEETSSKENENWLLAKKPMNNYLCASCEAYIGDLKNKEEKANWNKLINRKNKKNYRMGHGFSTMLKMLNSDLLKKIEKENLNNHSAINNSSTGIKPDNIKKMNKNLPKIHLQNQIIVNETQNLNNSNNEDINNQLNNSSSNLKTQIQFEKNELNTQGQLSDRDFNKNTTMNYFINSPEKSKNEEIEPKVIKIAKKNK